MIRTLLLPLLVALPLAAQPLDEAAYFRVCEPAEIRVETETLPPETWDAIDARAAEIPNGVGRLWRIEGEGGTSHLWGTYHLVDPRSSRLPPELHDVILAAGTVLLEWSSDEFDMARALNWAPVTGVTVGELPLSRAERRAIAAANRIWDLSDADIGWLPAKQLMAWSLTGLCDLRRSTIGFPSQDTLIEITARSRGIPVLGLEPFAILDEPFDDPARARQAASMLVLYALGQDPKLLLAEGPTMATVIAFALRGEIARDYALWVETTSAVYRDIDVEAVVAEADTFMLDERNRRMVTAATPHLEAGGALIAVGAYHLFGEQGLVALLRDAGYTVTRVPIEGEVRNDPPR